MNWVEEVCRTVRSAIEEEGRTARLIAIMITMTICLVLVRLAT